MGFDDIRFANSMVPSLTTIRQPRIMIGERAMNQLLDEIGTPNSEPVKELLHGDLVVRESCAPPRANGTF